MPTADVSARPAVAGDEDAIAAIQLAAWAALLGDAVTDLPSDEIRDRWADAITAAPSRGHKVFVACDGPRVVGFAAIAPAEIIALEVAPEHRRLGHGSRLLAACVDTMRVTGSAEIRTWAIAGDDAREAFLAGAGMGEGGLLRTFDGPRGEFTERMWRAGLE